MRYFFFILLSLLVLAAAPAFGTNIVFSDFSDASLLTLNDAAAPVSTEDGPVLRLTPALRRQSGRAFSRVPFNAAEFSTYFRFRISGAGGFVIDCKTESGGDGIVFVIQSTSSTINGRTGGIEYAGIANSIGVEFDTRCDEENNDPGSNHVGIDLNGDVTHAIDAPFAAEVTPSFDNGSLWHTWVDYSGTVLEVRISGSSSRPESPTLTRDVNIPGLLGQDSGYVGFTSGTGVAYGAHDIVYWEYRDHYDPIGGDDGLCASFDAAAGTVHVPCIDVGGEKLWVDLQLVPSEADLLLRVANAGLVEEGNGEPPDGEDNPPPATCIDCTCPEYAFANPLQCGQTGDLNFRIVWEDFNDVDIQVIYEGVRGLEVISWVQTTGSFGGKLDVDANSDCADAMTSSAVENVFYVDPPAGTYTLRVCGFEQCGAAAVTPVTAQILANGVIIQGKTVQVTDWSNTCVNVLTHVVN